MQYQNRKKNILVSLILVFFFGPLGLFYTNSIKALCMLLLLLVTIPLSIFRIYSNLIEFRITDELILWCVFFLHVLANIVGYVCCRSKQL